MTKLIENAQVVSSVFVPVSYVEFAAEAEKRGYTPKAWSSSQFILKTANGMRCEFMNSRGGKLGFGYTCSPRKVKALFDYFTANPGRNPVIDRYVTEARPLAADERRTMFTLKATNLADFFDIVDVIAKFEFPVAVMPKATVTPNKAVVKVAPKAEVKAIERAKTVEEMADIAAAASARFAKKTGKAF